MHWRVVLANIVQLYSFTIVGEGFNRFQDSMKVFAANSQREDEWHSKVETLFMWYYGNINVIGDTNR